MQQVLIVGLGQFGMSLARSLMEKGAEVLAVDRRPHLVEEIASQGAQAYAVDATDENALASLHPEKRDISVCAIGEDSKEASIICTALLRQMGAPRVLARAGSPLHRRILQLVGAHEVFNPEREFGLRLANRLAYHEVISDMPLGGDLHLTELAVPERFVGRSLADLALPKRYGVVVVAIRRGPPGTIALPSATDPLQEEDVLVLVSKESAVADIVKGR